MGPLRHRGPGGAARWRGLAAVGLGVIAGLTVAAGPIGTVTSGATSSPWTVVPSPNAAGAYYSALQSVSCPVATKCVAVGSSAAPTGPTPAVGQQVPLAEVGNGSKWTVSTVPQPAGTSPFSLLASVSCPDATHCVAVGATRSSLGVDVPLIETWDGTSWTLVTATGLASGYLTAVWCTSVSWCMAVGHSAGAQTAPTPPVSDVWNGTTWTAKVVTMAPTDTSGILTSVSCFSTANCVAVGTGTGPHIGSGGTFGDTSLGEVWNGVVWTMTGPLAQPPKTPSNLTGVELSGVSCVSALWCMGVGTYETAGQSVPFSEIWDGISWALTGSGPGAMEFADGVACSSQTSCVTVGGHGSQAAADPWTGSAWGYYPLPAFTSANYLVSVSCPAGGACTGVGAYETNDGANTLVEAAGVALTSPGYRLVASDGGVFAFTAPFHGSMGGHHLDAPIVGMASDPTTGGYWLVASDGGVFAFTAPFHGSMGGHHLDAPIVGMAVDPTTGGYWLVASDGGIFAFTAPFHGSMGGKPLNAPVVGMASDATTGGYWLVASDGGVFAFDAPFAGSRATTPGLLGKAVGIASDPTVGGYWIVTARGTVGVGQQALWGTLGGLALQSPVVGVVDDPATSGYWLMAADGGVFALHAAFAGSMGGTPLVAPIVGGAAAT